MNRASVVMAVALGICLAALAVACGGGGKEEGAIVSPTAEPERSPDATSIAMSPGERFRAQLLELLPEIEQIFSVEWPQALGTEPRFGEDWQDAVSRLAGRVEGFATRLEAMEPPEEFAVSHALLVDSFNRMAEAVRKVRIAGPNQDLEGLQEAMADTEIANQLWEEAFKEFETASPTPTRTAQRTAVPGTPSELAKAMGQCQGETWGPDEDAHMAWAWAVDMAGRSSEEFVAAIKERSAQMDNWESNLTAINDWVAERVSEAQRQDIMGFIIDGGPPFADCVRNELLGPPPPPQDRAGLEALLRSAMPSLEQLPSGFALEREEFETNEQKVADATELDPSLEELEAWGRLLGFATEYDRPGYDQKLRLYVEIFRTAGGAAKAFGEGAAIVETEEFAAEAREALSASTAEFDRISFVSLGEESNAFRGVMTVPQSRSGEIQLIVHSIGVRRGYLAGYIQVWSIAGSTPSMEELETLGRTLDEQIREALQ